MKIRIKNNTIRLRLTQTEVSDLADNNEIWDRCELIGGRLKYGILSSDIESMEASISDNEIQVKVSSDMLNGWESNNKIGFNCTMDNGTYILIEKDFKCLVDREHEDESNMYPNPLARD